MHDHATFWSPDGKPLWLGSEVPNLWRLEKAIARAENVVQIALELDTIGKVKQLQPYLARAEVIW
jgi:hypothetical protein